MREYRNHSRKIVFSSIPSPSSGSLDLGSLTLRGYGLMIALGVLAAVWLTAKRFTDRSLSADHAPGIAMWGVPAGIIGARFYHVITDWGRFSGNWGEAFKIWKGGLGILGGVIVGYLAAMIYCKRANLDLRTAMDVVAPAIPLAQMIGRWGNWFNQELYGRPSELPWALEIDPENRPVQHLEQATFHPTFLYESLWNLMVVLALIKIDRMKKLTAGMLFIVYLALYSIGRIWVEALRIDEATKIAGLRVNIWVFALLLLLSLGLLFKVEWKRGGVDASEERVQDPPTLV
ncbi:MAG: prolipoprotein diacylglyceryl transferase [Acidimicrobiaceae bacterium]|nr:prolipoprotein diacylglyceryl transferase [Acidimicrobiaceae bacterium]